MKTTTTLVTTLLMLTAIPLAAFPAEAWAVCPAAEPVEANGTRSGTVPSGGAHWYSHQVVGPATVSVQSGPSSDVDLQVWDETCQTFLCGSYAGTGDVDTCNVNGGRNYKVEILYYSGTGDYTATFQGTGPDADGDNVPDEVERNVCGRPVLADFINSFRPVLGTCTTTTNYDGSPYAKRDFTVVTGVKQGPDADRDGFPEHIQQTTTTVHFNPWTHQLVGTSTGTGASTTVDGEDNNPSVPVLSRITLPPLPTTVAFGPDNDRDLFVGYIYVNSTSYTIDRRDGSVAATPAGSIAIKVDEDDGDKNVPVYDVIGEVVDRDGDRIPDAVEPTICSVENQNSDLDGKCTTRLNGTRDYHPPFEAIIKDPWGSFVL